MEVYKFREPVEVRISQGNLLPQGWYKFTAKEMAKKISKSRNALHISEKHTYNRYSTPHQPKSDLKGISLFTTSLCLKVFQEQILHPFSFVHGFISIRTVYHLIYNGYARMLTKENKKGTQACL